MTTPVTAREVKRNIAALVCLVFVAGSAFTAILIGVIANI